MRKSLLFTLLTIPIIFKSAIRHTETAFSCNFIGINFEWKFEIHNLLAALTNQINVLCDVRLVAVIHLVKFQHFYDPSLGKLVQDGVDRR